MSIITMTGTFDFPIPAEYFPGFKVTKPYYARVCYEQTGPIVTVQSITMTPDTLRIVDLKSGLLNDINNAAMNNATSKREAGEEKAVPDERFEDLRKQLNW